MNSQPPPTREHRLIAAIQGWTQETAIGDDCAILPQGQLITVDALVEGTHFELASTSFADLGWKSLAVNLSDIAAMAGTPCHAVISLTMPVSTADHDVQQFYSGMVECARRYNCRLAGGDLSRGGSLVISVTILGEQHESGVLKRSGARPDDIVIVTGNFGASAAGLWLLGIKDRLGESLPAGMQAFLKTKHWRPEPRLKESWMLVQQNRGRGSLMDASDGLGDALIQIAQASGVGITVDESHIPIADATRTAAAEAGQNALNWALYGGEDYELVATISPSDWQELKTASDNPFRPIGTVNSGEGVILNRTDGNSEQLSLERTFQHW